MGFGRVTVALECGECPWGLLLRLCVWRRGEFHGCVSLARMYT